MASRLKLHEELCVILGTRNVYFQPPSSMNHPCIKYSRADVDKDNANNKPYRSTNRYTIIVIDRDPDSEIPDKILNHFPMCSFDRFYTSDNLNHTVLTLYY